MAPTADEIAQGLLEKGITQGWDVIHALSAHKVNELFQRQFVLNLRNQDHLPPLSGTVPVIRSYSVEFADLVLGHPLLAFDPDRAPGAALLTIPIVSGTASTIFTSAGATNVVSTQWITSAHGYAITGTVPLAKVKGDVEKETHVGLRFAGGKEFFADLGITDAAGTVLGTYFRDLLADPRTGLRGYSLGTLNYTPNDTDLTPAGDFEIATQRDPDDAADAGRVLLLIPTAYHPQGGGHAPLALNNLVPAGMDTTLLVSSKVIVGEIVRRIVAASFGEDAVIASDIGTGAWWVTVVRKTIEIPVEIKVGDIGSIQAGERGNPTPVSVYLGGIAFGPKGGRLTGSWIHSWPQEWSVEVDLGPLVPTVWDQGKVRMSITLASTYEPRVDPVTAVISFTAPIGLEVTFENIDEGGDTFRDFLFKKAEAREMVCGLIADAVRQTFGDLFDFTIPQVGAFAVTNLLFPGQQTTRLRDVRVPGDLVAFGTLTAPGLTVTPAMATVTTAETVRFAADQSVTWSVPHGSGTIDASGVYTPPAGLARSTVVVVTATAKDERAYAAVLVTPARVQITPVMSVFEADSVAQPFVAGLPGATGKPVWSISPEVGTVDRDTGVYTPPDRLDEPTVVTLTARIGEETGTARIVVFPTAPVAVQVTPYAPAPLGPGGTQEFTAALAGSPTRPEWSLLPQVGRIDEKGVYTAPDEVTAPQAVLVVARDRGTPALGGTAVVLLSPDGPQTGRTDDAS